MENSIDVSHRFENVKKRWTEIRWIRKTLGSALDLQIADLLANIFDCFLQAPRILWTAFWLVSSVTVRATIDALHLTEYGTQNS